MTPCGSPSTLTISNDVRLCRVWDGIAQTRRTWNLPTAASRRGRPVHRAVRVILTNQNSGPS